MVSTCQILWCLHARSCGVNLLDHVLSSYWIMWCKLAGSCDVNWLDWSLSYGVKVLFQLAMNSLRHCVNIAQQVPIQHSDTTF